MKEALELLGKVTGWGKMLRPIVGYDEIRVFTGPDETEGTGKFEFLCATSICGAGDAIKARGRGATLSAAMLDCAKNVVEYHKEIAKWHTARAEAAQKIIDAEFTEK